ncbi:MAG TPA: hypothetical protein VFS02_20635 [Telluria sp.]|nr:hypothetical protein [Telluria sp.]
MKVTPLILLPCIATALAAGGCATNAPDDPPAFSLPPIRQDTIATLAVDGANAFINGVRVPHGVYVRDGDTVTTGPNTSVTVVLNSGASVQLDQNTDPLFRAIRQGVCVLMELVRGQAAVATGGTCVEFRTARLNAAGVAHSILNIRAGESEMRVTVVEGQVDMQSPGAAAVRANEEYTSTQYGAWKVRQMTPAEAAASTDWTHAYFRPRASQRKPDYTIPAIVAGAAALLLLRDHGDRHPAAPSPDPRTGAAQGRASPQPAPAAAATPAVPRYGPRPAGPAAGMPAQHSGLCCLPGGGSTQASPLACTARRGQFYPAGTSPGVCPSPVR